MKPVKSLPQFIEMLQQDLINFISTLFYTSIIRKICQVFPEY